MPFTGERLRSRHPFQLFMLGSSVYYSAAGLLARDARPGSVQETIGQVGTTIWLVFVLLGALTALIGIFLRDRATGLYAEHVGLLTAGSATLFFVGAAYYVIGLSATAGVSVALGFGLACLMRSWDLHRILTGVRKRRDGYTQGD